MSESFFSKHHKNNQHRNQLSKKELPKQQEKTFKGVTIYADEPCDRVDEAFDMCTKHWDSIIKDASETLYDHLDGYPNVDIPKQYKTMFGMKKYLKLTGGSYSPHSGGVYYAELTLSFDIEFDKNHFIDSSIRLSDKSMSIDSSFNG